ncbi:hypothetical protein [Bosea sp. ANAM02]|uniref:hypothetical protein n=1 Tax=Bosea sp. ANAM02 TaxID=2020412 RepID=UPI00140EE900|nr:hypothetical protein [Bosea sp. ANAM02]BCB21964.1 hypothetical protein OCUBac02_48580 [Bosea sp. ANAM02]
MLIRSITLLTWVAGLFLATASAVRAETSERCEIPAGTTFVYVPTEVTIYSDRNRLNVYFSTTKQFLAPFRSITASGDRFVLELFTDGMPVWVVAPRSDLWRFQFESAKTLVKSPTDLRLQDAFLQANTAERTMKCAVAERREQARLLFEKGYAKLSSAPGDAEKIFREGLDLDSENATAILYWGHAQVLTGSPYLKGAYEAFQEALLMGLPDDLGALARAHIRNLERRSPCYKEWYGALPKIFDGACQ